MSGCESFELLLAIRLDGPLVPEEEAELCAHLETCNHCRALERDLHSMRETFPTIAPQPPINFTASVLSQLPSRKHLPRRAWGGLAAVCALVLIGVGVVRPWQFTPQPETDRQSTLAAKVLPSEPTSVENAEAYEEIGADIGVDPDDGTDTASSAPDMNGAAPTPSATAPSETAEAPAALSAEMETLLIAPASVSATPALSPESDEGESAPSSDIALAEDDEDLTYAGSGKTSLAILSPSNEGEDGTPTAGSAESFSTADAAAIIEYTAEDARLLLIDYLTSLTPPLDTTSLTYLSFADDKYYFSIVLSGGETLYYTVTAEGGEITQVDAPPA